MCHWPTAMDVWSVAGDASFVTLLPLLRGIALPNFHFQICCEHNTHTHQVRARRMYAHGFKIPKIYYTLVLSFALLCLWQKRTSAAVMVFLLSSLSRLRPFYQMPRDKRKRLLFSSDYILYLYVYYAVTTIGSYVGLMSFVRWRQHTHSIYILSGRRKDNSQPPAGARNVYIIFMHKLSERRKQTRVP